MQDRAYKRKVSAAKDVDMSSHKKSYTVDEAISLSLRQSKLGQKDSISAKRLSRDEVRTSYSRRCKLEQKDLMSATAFSSRKAASVGTGGQTTSRSGVRLGAKESFFLKDHRLSSSRGLAFNRSSESASESSRILLQATQPMDFNKQIMGLLRSLPKSQLSIFKSHISEEQIDHLYRFVSQRLQALRMSSVISSQPKIPNVIDQTVKVINLFPYEYLVRHFNDIITEVVLKVNDLVDQQYLYFKGNKIGIDQVIPFLEIYSKVLGSLVHRIKSLHIINMEGRQNSTSSTVGKSASDTSELNFPSIDSSIKLDATAISLQDHESLEVRFLSEEIIKSIQILSDTQKIEEFFHNTGNILLLDNPRVVRFSKGSIEGIIPISKYNNFIEIVKTQVEDWHATREIVADRIMGSKKDTDILLCADQIKMYCKKKNVDLSWKRAYLFLKLLLISVSGHRDDKIKENIINLCGEIALEESYSEKVRDIAIEMLAYAGSSKDEQLKGLAHDKMGLVRNVILGIGNDDYVREAEEQADDYDLQKEKTLLTKAGHTVKSFKEAFEMLKKDLDSSQGDKRHEIIGNIRRLKEQFDATKNHLKDNNLLVEGANRGKARSNEFAAKAASSYMPENLNTASAGKSPSLGNKN